MVPLEANDVQTNLADHWMYLEGLLISQIKPTSKHICVLGQIKSLDLKPVDTKETKETNEPMVMKKLTSKPPLLVSVVVH